MYLIYIRVNVNAWNTTGAWCHDVEKILAYLMRVSDWMSQMKMSLRTPAIRCFPSRTMMQGFDWFNFTLKHFWQWINSSLHLLFNSVQGTKCFFKCYLQSSSFKEVYKFCKRSLYVSLCPLKRLIRVQFFHPRHNFVFSLLHFSEMKFVHPRKYRFYTCPYNLFPNCLAITIFSSI